MFLHSLPKRPVEIMDRKELGVNNGHGNFHEEFLNKGGHG